MPGVSTLMTGVDLSLIGFARTYCEKNNLRSTPLHNANRFVRVVCRDAIQHLSTNDLCEFRQRAAAENLSPWTIEKTITDVITLIAAATGRTLDAGRRLKRPRPMPQPPTVEVINAVFMRAEIWLQQWIVIGLWTGLRLTDSMKLQLALDSQGKDALRLRANKTGHGHNWPRPGWIERWLQPVPLPYNRANHNARKRVRMALSCAAIAADVPVIHPKQLRQRSVNEWSRSNGMAGAIVHGSGLRVLNHYVDPLTVLEAAAGGVRLPEGFGRGSDQSEEIALLFRRLDSDAQTLIASTARRLATG